MKEDKFEEIYISLQDDIDLAKERGAYIKILPYIVDNPSKYMGVCINKKKKTTLCVTKEENIGNELEIEDFCNSANEDFNDLLVLHSINNKWVLCFTTDILVCETNTHKNIGSYDQEEGGDNFEIPNN